MYANTRGNILTPPDICLFLIVYCGPLLYHNLVLVPPSSSLTLLITPHICIYLTNPSPYHTCGCSLQMDDWTALLLASNSGHTLIVQALVAAPGIDVNHATVSILYSPQTCNSFCFTPDFVVAITPRIHRVNQ